MTSPATPLLPAGHGRQRRRRARPRGLASGYPKPAVDACGAALVGTDVATGVSSLRGVRVGR